MNRLPIIIGLAPSELSWEDFLTKLSSERQRVRESLEAFRAQTQKTPRRPKGATKVGKSLEPFLAQLGLSPAELIKGLAILREQEKNKQPKPPPER